MEIEGTDIESGLSELGSVESVERLDPINSRKRYRVNLSGSSDARPERMRLEDVFHTLTVANQESS